MVLLHPMPFVAGTLCNSSHPGPVAPPVRPEMASVRGLRARAVPIVRALPEALMPTSASLGQPKPHTSCAHMTLGAHRSQKHLRPSSTGLRVIR